MSPVWLGPAHVHAAGTTGYVNQELVSTHLPAAALGDKAKIFVCGT